MDVSILTSKSQSQFALMRATTHYQLQSPK
ncbi:TPA: hypothetical protein N0F65_001970 [Lagenidium giganteum]|uniref:Uncharacterized protein n=1 Tax=Lagenidium giganteum TaxID=4803 RepID=A0AAV2YN19_9STRA|nr:TPA: hypothetical protein N0F65_001970 [Lagenidium giganteum]